jgi:hypothetical protein
LIGNDHTGKLYVCFSNDRVYFTKSGIVVNVPAEFTPAKSDEIVVRAVPNPFNPQTTISYTLPENARVELKIFDVLGREVVSLIDDFEQAGTHSVSFDGSLLASGVYFYRLVADQFTATKKLLLLR